MKKSTKKGVTLASLVIYIVLFTSLTIFVSITSTNMNERLFDNRGEAINYSNLNKLQYNIENSAIESNDVSVTDYEIVFSNGDRYTYSNEQRAIYKNGGVLCLNVDNLTINADSSEDVKKLTLNISFNKYLNTIDKTLITCVEGS